MTLIERANCTCDSLAKRILQKAIYLQASLTSLPLSSWTISHNGMMIYDDIDDKIQCIIAEIDLIPFLEKQGLPRDLFQSIEWNVLETSLKGFPECFQLWYSKHISNFLAISKQIVYRKEWLSSRCLCCVLVNETDTFHLFQCTNKELQMTRNLLFHNLFKKLQELDSYPEIINMYRNILFCSSVLTFVDLLLDAAYHDLRRLGAKQLLHGLIPTSVMKLQEIHLSNSRSSQDNGVLK